MYIKLSHYGTISPTSTKRAVCRSALNDFQVFYSKYLFFLQLNKGVSRFFGDRNLVTSIKINVLHVKTINLLLLSLQLGN